jgi:O-antigen ligase
VVNAGGQADVAQLLLQDTHGNNLLDNATFQQGLAQWPVLAQSYFLPWHIDNLLLELLIERGLLGLLLFATLLGAALWQLTRDSLRGAALAPYQAAALLGTLCVGASGSLLDVPRVALLLYVLALDALVCGPYRAIELAVACEKSMAAKGRPHRLHF